MTRSTWGSLGKRRTRSGYWLRYVEDGRRHCVFAGKKLKEARAFRRETEARVLHRRLHVESSLAEFLADVYLPLRTGRLAAKTWTTERAALLAAAKHFGPMQMHEVTPTAADQWLTGLPVAAATRVRYRSNLSSCWRAAIDRGLAQVNPWRAVTLPRGQETSLPFLTQLDLDRIAAAAPARLRDLVTVLGETGLRLGEALGLEWRDVAGDLSAVAVRKSKSRRTRVVPLTGRAREVFGRRRCGGPTHEGPVPAGGLGVFADVPRGREGELAYSARVLWRATVKDLGLAHLRLHHLRHARAALLVRAGVPVPTVSKWLGHATPALVLTRYGHHAPEDALTRALESLEQSESSGSSASPGPRDGSAKRPRV